MKPRIFIQTLAKYARIIGTVLGIISSLTVCDFWLLVTSLGFHWWQPTWGATASHIMLVCLVVFSTIISLLYILRLGTKVQAYRKSGYEVSVVRQLITAVEGATLLILCAAWGQLALAGHNSTSLLKTMGITWASGFVGFTVLQIYELRRKRRYNLHHQV